MKIGKILTDLRKKRGLTQDQMADILDVKRARYNSWENDIAKPNIEMLNRIADFHGVETDYILGRSSSLDYTNTPPSIKAWLRSGNPDLTEDEKDTLAEELEEYFTLRKNRILKNREE